MNDVPDEAREAALLALATKFALIESPVNLVVDAVLDAAAPHIRAAERQRPHDRIEAIRRAADDEAGEDGLLMTIAEVLMRRWQTLDTTRLCYQGDPRVIVQAVLKAALVSPVSESQQ